VFFFLLILAKQEFCEKIKKQLKLNKQLHHFINIGEESFFVKPKMTRKKKKKKFISIKA